MSEMTPDTRPLSQRMLLDGMYPGIVEKWAAEVAGLEARIEALDATARAERSHSMSVEEDLERMDKVIEYWKNLAERLRARIEELEKLASHEAHCACVPTLEARIEALKDALEHCGYDPNDCIDCGGPPREEHCRFWKLRDEVPALFYGTLATKGKPTDE